MTEIDNKKMWEALIQHRSNGKIMAVVVANIVTALNKQGLTVNDNGEIVSIEPEFKIEAGKWYMCIKTSFNPYVEGGRDFIDGKVYYAFANSQMHGERVDVEISNDSAEIFFRPATEEEIPHEPYFEVGDRVRRKGTGRVGN